jgi:steroid 5-alpha reductase family enzyme
MSVEAVDHISTLPPAPHRPVSALQCYLTYIASLLVGIVTWVLLLEYSPNTDPFMNGLITTTVCTLVIWIFSIANDNSSLYDPYWVIAPPFLALAVKGTSVSGLGDWHTRGILILICLFAWAIRYHVFYAWSGWFTGLVHEDWRYESMRSAPVPYWLNSLVGMHYFPTYLVYYAFAPAALVLLSDPAAQPAAGWWDVLGTTGALAAVAIQYFSDQQCAVFRESDEYRNGGAIQHGLWAYSRHPNYFGEVLFWLSMIPFAIGAGLYNDHQALVLSGPIAMMLFFRGSSWLMDVRSLERRPGYQKVMDEVSAMMPCWPKKPH